MLLSNNFIINANSNVQVIIIIYQNGENKQESKEKRSYETVIAQSQSRTKVPRACFVQ